MHLIICKHSETPESQNNNAKRALKIIATELASDEKKYKSTSSLTITEEENKIKFKKKSLQL